MLFLIDRVSTTGRSHFSRHSSKHGTFFGFPLICKFLWAPLYTGTWT